MRPDIAEAVALLRRGELVAFPTETVYGLGADAANPAAVAKIFAAKDRPADHPLIVHLPSADHLTRWASDVPGEAKRLAAAFWPGPLTLILKRQANVPDAVTGGQDTVGLRVPNHPLALELLAAFDGANGGGLAAPSANRFGRISPTTAAHVREELGERVSLILDGGPCPVGIESTILDLSRGSPVLLRPGAIGAADIARVIGHVPEMALPQTDAPRVSGSLEAHYAPRTPLQLVSSDGLLFALRDALVAGERVAVLAPTAQAISHELVSWRQVPADPAGCAHDLYASLRELDALGCARILVQKPPAGDIWLAVNDRLSRAAAGSGEDDET
ncbi:MAG: L-threonylcarbamoyladenylate synthase [Rhodocyclaceae bacterium]|nr:threonylcarbamoyl-AMP synthase [Rhodocyclaceae bacterium]MCW5595982.1 threonylcarbamoyl-AMP synthase [Rhodocyclaceae bacterium]PKO71006.1 MAG: threonylcarbamoyl-AMP synthase [Betaproteobacteria bacterium HGW-Betaproteobacteria-14]